jgi:hypothetical protein
MKFIKIPQVTFPINNECILPTLVELKALKEECRAAMNYVAAMEKLIQTTCQHDGTDSKKERICSRCGYARWALSSGDGF